PTSPRGPLSSPSSTTGGAKLLTTFLGALGFRFGLGLGTGGHLLDPLQALLVGHPPLGDVEGEGGGLGGIILLVGQAAPLVGLGHDPTDVLVPLGVERAGAVLDVTPL